MSPASDVSASRTRPHIRIRVMLVDDHAVMRKGLSSILFRNEDIEVVGEAGDEGQSVDLARQLKPDVILMDISMPGMDGIEAIRQLAGDKWLIKRAVGSW